MDEEDEDRDHKYQRNEKSSSCLQPSLVPEHNHFSRTISRKISRKSSGATSIATPPRSCARWTTPSTLPVARIVSREPSCCTPATPAIRKSLSPVSCGRTRCTRRYDSRK